MSSSVVDIRDLRKIYQVPERDAGMGAAWRSLFRRKTRDVAAVDGISLTVAPGEIVGFLGPNGAGKTTTLKMLAGLLYPTSGEARVLGHEPFKREQAFLRQITLVMGQRSQLEWDLPVGDSLELHKIVYDLSEGDYRRTRDELAELLELGPLLPKPARTLSLGERMKCEMALALLHRPRVLFLDEPTIGLDVTMQRRIRAFIKAYNQRSGSSVLLTSHYMADVEALCRRVVVIHRGKLLFDGELGKLVQRFSTHKTLVIRLHEGKAVTGAAQFGEVMDQQDGQITLRVSQEKTAQVTARVLAEWPVEDLTVEDPPIEDAIDRVFQGTG